MEATTTNITSTNEQNDEKACSVTTAAAKTANQQDACEMPFYHNSGSDHVLSEVVLSAKWGPCTVNLSFSPIDYDTFTLLDLKRKIEQELDIPSERQKLLGFVALVDGKKMPPKDETLLSQLEFQKSQNFVLVGTTRKKAFVDPSMCDNLPEVLDDFDYSPEAAFSIRTQVHLTRLQRAITTTEIRIIRHPRPNKSLLVLDLDYTLIDCKGGGLCIEDLKRPYVDQFLMQAYAQFDIAVWSQTQWRWVEMKCTELGLLTNVQYGICFALDRSSMFTVSSRQSDGSERSHEVKALEIIWRKFPQWGPHNTIHVDDIARNFAFNPRNGVKVSSYRKHKRQTDNELLLLASYLSWLSLSATDMSAINHAEWRDKVRRAML